MRPPFWGLDSDRERREASAAAGRKPGRGITRTALSASEGSPGIPGLRSKTGGPQGRNPEAPECVVGSALSRSFRRPVRKGQRSVGDFIKAEDTGGDDNANRIAAGHATEAKNGKGSSRRPLIAHGVERMRAPRKLFREEEFRQPRRVRGFARSVLPASRIYRAIKMLSPHRPDQDAFVQADSRC